MLALAVFLVEPVFANNQLYKYNGWSWTTNADRALVPFKIDVQSTPVQCCNALGKNWLDPDLFYSRIIDAANAWNARSALCAGTPCFSLSYRGNITAPNDCVNLGDLINVVGWADPNQYPTPSSDQEVDNASAVAWTSFQYDRPAANPPGLIMEANTCFVKGLNWDATSDNIVDVVRYHIYTTALHEFGHWIKLLDLCNNNVIRPDTCPLKFGGNCPGTDGNGAGCNSQIMWFNIGIGEVRTFQAAPNDGDVEGLARVYHPTIVVGGNVLPVAKISLLTPYIEFALAIATVTFLTTIYLSRAKERNN